MVNIREAVGKKKLEEIKKSAGEKVGINPEPSSNSLGRTPDRESPEGEKDNRDFANVVQCPICGFRFAQDCILPKNEEAFEDVDKSAHLKALEHHAEEHPDKGFKGVKPVK